ncbi:MAG: ATP-binding cassette domain-containing protein [Leucobacter sp.]
MSRLLAAEEVSVVVDGATLLPPASLALEPGECVAVLGPNGAGKTTLLRVLAGRLRPSSGRALLRGDPLDERRREVRRELSALLDPPALYPDLTLGENLVLVEAAWSGEAAWIGAAERSRLAPGLGAFALEAFGIEALRDRFPDELSSGQRQLTSLAVAFARPANALLLDEPEQRLDPYRRGLLADAMIAARSRGASIVFASHDEGLVERVADRQVRVGV